MMAAAATFKLVVFDAYGTLFDVYGMGVLAEALYPGHGAQIAAAWRDKQIEYTRLISLSDPHAEQGSRHYLPFWDLTRLALQYTLRRFGLPESATNEDALMGQYARLTPHPENRAVLEALKARGLPCAILSNGNGEMLDAVVAGAGFAGLLDAVISIESIRQFKTMPAAYALVLARFPAVQREEVLFVSSNAWDALGATWFGFAALWVNRHGLPQETLGPAPRFTGRDLSAVLSAL